MRFAYMDEVGHTGPGKRQNACKTRPAGSCALESRASGIKRRRELLTLVLAGYLDRRIPDQAATILCGQSELHALLLRADVFAVLQ
jgi:hypothetical protein